MYETHSREGSSSPSIPRILGRHLVSLDDQTDLADSLAVQQSGNYLPTALVFVRHSRHRREKNERRKKGTVFLTCDASTFCDAGQGGLEFALDFQKHKLKSRIQATVRQVELKDSKV